MTKQVQNTTYIWNFYEGSGHKLQMAKVPTTICLEIAFNGKKEIIWIKATEIYQWQEAHNSNREKKKGEENEHLFFDEESWNYLCPLGINKVPSD